MANVLQNDLVQYLQRWSLQFPEAFSLVNEWKLSFQIYTKGCIPTIKGLLDNNLYLIGGITLGVALMQLLGKYILTLKMNLCLVFHSEDRQLVW